jgi:hypothetical protein
LAAADNNGRRFGHHCRWRTSPNSIKQEINFYLYLVNLFNHFDGSIVMNMRKASHPSGDMG